MEKPFKCLRGFFVDFQQYIMLKNYLFSHYLTSDYFAGKRIFIIFADL